MDERVFKVADSADWPQQRRSDWAAGYEFARSEMSEERTSCSGCDVHSDMRRFVTPWESVSDGGEDR